MPLVHLLTGAVMPKPDPETHLVAAALEARGASAPVLSWTDPQAGAGDADVAVIRTTWDYIARRDEFVEWCRGTAARMPLHNPPEVVAWNSHKGYLTELAAAGVPTVPTRVLGPGDELPAFDGGAEVVKPAVSSGAFGAARFPAAETEAAAEHLRAVLAEGDAVVQPFVESVPVEGERSLIFLGGELSHAVNKQPAQGDYRVQAHYGGQVLAHHPEARELEVAAAALATVTLPLLYARVDLVRGPDGPQVIELELIEPELFLGSEPSAPDRLAELILAAA